MSNLNGVHGSPLLQTLLSQTSAVASNKESRGATGSTAATNTCDSAAVSTTASALLRSTGADDVRMEKVNAIREAVANGTYSVPSSDVADKLIQSLLNTPARG